MYLFKRHKDAILVYEKLLALDPNDENTRDTLKDLYGEFSMKEKKMEFESSNYKEKSLID